MASEEGKEIVFSKETLSSLALASKLILNDYSADEVCTLTLRMELLDKFNEINKTAPAIFNFGKSPENAKWFELIRVACAKSEMKKSVLLRVALSVCKLVGREVDVITNETLGKHVRLSDVDIADVELDSISRPPISKTSIVRALSALARGWDEAPADIFKEEFSGILSSAFLLPEFYNLANVETVREEALALYKSDAYADKVTTVFKVMCSLVTLELRGRQKK